MALEDLSFLESELPEVFEHQVLPPTWEEDRLFIPLDDPAGPDSPKVAGPVGAAHQWSPNEFFNEPDQPVLNRLPDGLLELPLHNPDLGEAGGFPGAPQKSGWQSRCRHLTRLRFVCRSTTSIRPGGAFISFLKMHSRWRTTWPDCQAEELRVAMRLTLFASFFTRMRLFTIS
jgi:hypothetical protein